MQSCVIYEGKAFVSFNSGHHDIELVDIVLMQLGIGVYELRSSRQRAGHQILITTLDGRTIQGLVLSQATGITQFKSG